MKKKSDQWNFALEGTTCPVCRESGTVIEHGDNHRSTGIVPCPMRSWRGYGFPTCHKGKLKFNKEDLKNRNKLKA